MTSDTLLTSEIGLVERIDPTGKRWDVGVAPGGHAMYMIALVDDDGGMSVPRSYPADWPQLTGRWTHKDRALFVLDAYLREVWEMSDAQTARNSRGRATNKTPHKEVDIIAQA
jgi:hypothetical protein